MFLLLPKVINTTTSLVVERKKEGRERGEEREKERGRERQRERERDILHMYLVPLELQWSLITPQQRSQMDVGEETAAVTVHC
jgi:hypothetical protein